MSTANIIPKSPSNIPEFSVSEVAFAIKKLVEGSFERIRVRGEISGLSRPASGHMYFKLKDADAAIDGVCWKFSVPKLSIKPEDGMEVVVVGKMSTYPAGSRYQIIVDSIELAGQGALLKLLEDRKKKLAAEGLFDPARKKPIPFLPRTIGVITSPTGSVIRDILHRLSDRFPLPVLVWPVPVQGEGSALQIVHALRGFAELPVDGALPRPNVIIVARGGGSVEDLWEFNDENLVRAVAACPIPVISAIGHETDFTLIDFVADVRAPTPTAAAEMAVPVRGQLQANVAERNARMMQAISRQMQLHKTHLQSLGRGLVHPRSAIALLQQKLDEKSARLLQSMQNLLLAKRNRVQKIGVQPALLRAELQRQRQITAQFDKRMQTAIGRIVQRRQDALAKNAQLLQSLSYERVLDRGFALVLDDQNQAVTSVQFLDVGKDYAVRLKDGSAVTTVKSKKLR